MNNGSIIMLLLLESQNMLTEDRLVSIQPQLN